MFQHPGQIFTRESILAEIWDTNEEYVKRNKITKKISKNNEYTYLEDMLNEKLGTKVKIKNNKIEISFTNTNDLNRLLEIMHLDK